MTAAIAVLAAIVIGPTAPGARANAPADARALVAAQVLPRNGTSPLQQYLALRNGDWPVRLTVTTSHPRERLRMATLTRFDGTYWTVGGDYRRAGTRLPSSPAEGRPVTVTQQVRVDAGEDHLGWLVAAGRPSTVSVSGMGVDEATGDVAIPIGTTRLPTLYSVTSRRGRVTGVGDDAVPAPARDPLPPPMPPAIRGFLDQAVAGETSRLGKLRALYDRFTRSPDFYYDEAKDAGGGHGYYQIQRLITAPTKRGTSEQYASAFAVLARHLGMDARVVMGFQPHERHGNSVVVKGTDAYAWVEIRFTGRGWVTFDPRPARTISNAARERRTVAAPAGQPDDPFRNPNGARGRNRSSTSPNAKGAAGTGAEPADGLLTTRVLIAAVLLALVLVVLAAPTGKAIRRARRRRDRSPRRAVLGAWWETTDRLREAGFTVGPALTTGDVIRLTPEVDEVRRLAAMVDAAAYAPGGPPPDIPAQAWDTATAVHHRLRAGMPTARRIRALLDPRPLLRSR